MRQQSITTTTTTTTTTTHDDNDDGDNDDNDDNNDNDARLTTHLVPERRHAVLTVVEGLREDPELLRRAGVVGVGGRHGGWRGVVGAPPFADLIRAVLRQQGRIVLPAPLQCAVVPLVQLPQRVDARPS